MDIETKRVNISWTRLCDVTNSKKRIMVGICHHSKRIFTISRHSLTPLVVNDIIVMGEKCEESYHCMCTTCSLNQTTREMLARSLGIKPEKMPACFPEKIGALDFSEFVEEHPNGGIFIPMKKLKNPSTHPTSPKNYADG